MKECVYPPTPTDDVVEVLHGVAVPDPYRWLEDGESAAVQEWTRAQNRLTQEQLVAFPERERLRLRITELMSVGTIKAPNVKNGRLFYERQEGRQNQPILYWR